MSLRFGIAGCGMIGRIYADRLRALGHCVVAAADPDVSRAAAIAGQDGAYAEARAMFAEERIDVACICSPSPFHHRAVLDAAAAKLDVFLEKPMGMTLDEALEMASAMARAKRRLGFGFKMRFETLFAAARRLVEDGTVGPLRRASFGFYQPLPPGERIWYAETGILRDMLVHIFDLSRWTLGDDAAGVRARTERTLGHRGEDEAIVEIDFSGGGRAIVQGGYLPGFPDVAGREDIVFQLVGERGYLFGKRPDLLMLVDGKGTRSVAVTPVDAFAAELDAFARAIVADAPLPVSGLDGLRAQAVIAAAEQSAAVGGARVAVAAHAQSDIVGIRNMNGRPAEIRLLLHSMACPERDPEGAVDLARALDLDGVELICQAGYACAIAPDAPLGEARRLATIARRRGISIACLVPYAKGMNAEDAETRAAAHRELDRCLSLAAELGASRMRVFAGNEVAAAREAAAIARMADTLRRLGDRALALGISLCIENHMDTMATTAAATRRIVDAIDHAAFGILYDQANLDFMRAEPFAVAFDLQREAIRHVHVKDFRWTGSGVRRAAVVGEGIVPWEGIVRALVRSGYDGFLSFEYERRWFPDELPPAAEGVARSRDHVRRLLAEATGL